MGECLPRATKGTLTIVNLALFSGQPLSLTFEELSAYLESAPIYRPRNKLTERMKSHQPRSFYLSRAPILSQQFTTQTLSYFI